MGKRKDAIIGGILGGVLGYVLGALRENTIVFHPVLIGVSAVAVIAVIALIAWRLMRK